MLATKRWRSGLASTSLLAMVSLAPQGYAQTTVERVGALLARPPAAAKETERGHKASFFCANCHGADGHSKFPEVPNLAGQQPVYLAAQIDAFASGERRNDFMQGLIKVIDAQDRAAIALYFSRQPARPSRTEPGEGAPQGRAAFQQLCATCHGDAALGRERFPRLAGQQPEYLRNTLTRFLTRSGERVFAPMSEAVGKLGAERIDAVVDYLSALN